MAPFYFSFPLCNLYLVLVLLFADGQRKLQPWFRSTVRPPAREPLMEVVRRLMSVWLMYLQQQCERSLVNACTCGYKGSLSVCRGEQAFQGSEHHFKRGDEFGVFLFQRLICVGVLMTRSRVDQNTAQPLKDILSAPVRYTDRLWPQTLWEQSGRIVKLKLYFYLVQCWEYVGLYLHCSIRI